MINSKVTNISNIRKKNIPYMISWMFFYSWMVSFFTWWVNDFKTSNIFSEKSLYSIYFLSLLFVGIIIFIIKPEKFKSYFKIGTIFTMIFLVTYHGFIQFNFTKYLKCSVVMLSLSIGVSYVGLLLIYIYIMNNTEKFYSSILGNILLMLIALIENFKVLDITNNYIFLVVILFISMLPLTKFNTKDYLNEKKEHKPTAPKISKTMYLSVILNCIFMIFCRGVGRALILLTNDMYSFDLEVYYYAGGVVGIILIILIYTYIRKCNSITWNLIFSSFVFAAFLYMWPTSGLMKGIFAFVLGICIMMGIISMYYMVGIISKKYWNYSYIKYNILAIDVLGCCVGTTLGNYIYKCNDTNIIIIILTISVFIVLVTLITSPIMTTTFFSGEWDIDSTKAIIDNENIRKYIGYNLTKREIEICNCLEKNLTVRQIAADMNISENTVKFHKKQIFKKLNINSKEEISDKIKE